MKETPKVSIRIIFTTDGLYELQTRDHAWKSVATFNNVEAALDVAGVMYVQVFGLSLKVGI